MLDGARPGRAPSGLGLVATLTLASCTLIDLSHLSDGTSTGAAGGAASTSTTGASTSSEGGAGGGPPAIHRLYVVGGREFTSTPLDTIFVATIGDDGVLAPFDDPPAKLPESRQNHSLAIVDRSMFVIGGLSPTGDFPGVMQAPIEPDGGFGPWAILPNTLPGPVGRGASVVAGEHVYLIGGQDNDSVENDWVLGATVSGGTISSFTQVDTLPNLLSDETGVNVGDAVIVTGGLGSFSTQVLIAPLAADGSLTGPFSAGPSLQQGRDRHCTVTGVVGGVQRVYVVAGASVPAQSAIEMASYEGGALSSWEVSAVSIESPFSPACALYGNWIYLIGGVFDSNSVTTIDRIDLDPATGLPIVAHAERDLPQPRGYMRATVIDVTSP